MSDFRDIDKSRKILGLGETSDKAGIQSAYRKLAVKHHPDQCPDKDKKKCEVMFKKVTDAYNIIKQYCEEYMFSFKEEDVKRNSDTEKEKDHLKRFYEGW